ncbi:MAG: DUF4349 domain-containing protein [Candidatus Peribacteraceae bacterium]|nr:DUF4349 domain-containing protein [Candidatus Peribacteraceae bacterium]MDD5742941.1 DUF4349 domain-containing protein [Candidatus Peribacteraceae bacterium]
MKKVLLWIAGIVLAVVVIGIIAVFASAFFDNGPQGRQWQESAYDGVDMLNGKISAPARSPMPTSVQEDSVRDSAFAGQVQERVIIRSARMSLVASNVQEAVSALRTYTEEHSGFVVSAEVQTQENKAPRATVSLRIPAENLDAALSFIRLQALRVTSESVSGEDVTEEYVDLKARLTNLEASERQFLVIMKDARKTEDVLSVQREIERVRGEIESLTARKKYLEESAKLSSVVISIATDEASLPVVDARDAWRPLVVAKSAAAALVDMLKLLVNVVIWAIVFVPVWGTAILVVRYWKRRRLSVP